MYILHYDINEFCVSEVESVAEYVQAVLKTRDNNALITIPKGFTLTKLEGFEPYNELVLFGKENDKINPFKWWEDKNNEYCDH